MKDTRILKILDHTKTISFEIHNLRNVLEILNIGFENVGLETAELAMSAAYITEKILDSINKEHVEPLEKLLLEMSNVSRDEEDEG